MGLISNARLGKLSLLMGDVMPKAGVPGWVELALVQAHVPSVSTKGCWQHSSHGQMEDDNARVSLREGL